MDLTPRGKRRRRRTTEQKQMIAAECLSPGASATDTARLHGIDTGQLYTWRAALKEAQPDASSGAVPRFAHVEIAPEPAPPPDIAPWPPGLIEIALFNGATLRVDAGIDPRALRRVLAVLRR